MHEKKKRKMGSAPNGDIPKSAELSMALRWFAGGEPADIFQVHGVLSDCKSRLVMVEWQTRCDVMKTDLIRLHTL